MKVWFKFLIYLYRDFDFYLNYKDILGIVINLVNSMFSFKIIY